MSKIITLQGSSSIFCYTARTFYKRNAYKINLNEHNTVLQSDMYGKIKRKSEDNFPPFELLIYVTHFVSVHIICDAHLYGI